MLKRFFLLLLMGSLPYSIIRYLGKKDICYFDMEFVCYKFNWYVSIVLLIVFFILYIYVYKKLVKGNSNYIVDILYFFGFFFDILLLLSASTYFETLIFLIASMLTFLIATIRLVIRLLKGERGELL